MLVLVVADARAVCHADDNGLMSLAVTLQLLGLVPMTAVGGSDNSDVGVLADCPAVVVVADTGVGTVGPAFEASSCGTDVGCASSVLEPTPVNKQNRINVKQLIRTLHSNLYVIYQNSNMGITIIHSESPNCASKINLLIRQI